MLISTLDPKTWSDALQEAVNAEEVKVIPYDLTLNYDYWNYCMIVRYLATGLTKEIIR